MSKRPRITEADAERMVDRLVQRRLSTDRPYINAPDAQTQSEREDEIGSEIWTDIEARYEIV